MANARVTKELRRTEAPSAWTRQIPNTGLGGITRFHTVGMATIWLPCLFSVPYRLCLCNKTAKLPVRHNLSAERNRLFQVKMHALRKNKHRTIFLGQKFFEHRLFLLKALLNRDKGQLPGFACPLADNRSKWRYTDRLAV